MSPFQIISFDGLNTPPNSQCDFFKMWGKVKMILFRNSPCVKYQVSRFSRMLFKKPPYPPQLIYYLNQFGVPFVESVTSWLRAQNACEGSKRGIQSKLYSHIGSKMKLSIYWKKSVQTLLYNKIVIMLLFPPD